MPFLDKQDAGAFELTPGMPRPLTVAILDKPQEREGRTTAAVVAPFAYRDEVEKLLIEVPKTFLTDFASIPGWARVAFSPFGRHAKAAVLHDWLYAIGEPCRREVADRVFDHAMKELEVDDLARKTVFSAVRLGGGSPYKRAERDWPLTFVNVVTGTTIDPLFERSQAFTDAPYGPRRL